MSDIRNEARIDNIASGSDQNGNTGRARLAANAAGFPETTITSTGIAMNSAANEATGRPTFSIAVFDNEIFAFDVT